jgi:hypothetical protein
MPSSLSVQLLDITEAGVLLQASQPVDDGSEGRLSLNLDGVPLKASLHVERVAAAEQPPGYRVGATFVDLTSDQRQLIRRFMAQ